MGALYFVASNNVCARMGFAIRDEAVRLRMLMSLPRKVTCDGNYDTGGDEVKEYSFGYVLCVGRRINLLTMPYAP